MESLKHECGVAMIRLRRPIEYYEKKYGSISYGLSKLYLLMEKQHNRGQEAAGIGVVKLNPEPGHEYVFRERAIGTGAIQEIFDKVGAQLSSQADTDIRYRPFIGNIYMGHLRYSTTGKSGISYVHPFLRRNNWRSRNLLMCGNFNLTNVEEIFDIIVKSGQHPRIYSDTVMLLEQLGLALDRENHRVYREYREKLSGNELTVALEDNIDISNMLAEASPTWDGGYVICGATGSGDMFVLRDPHGIRPVFYYIDDEVVVVASERPVVQTVFNVPIEEVRELNHGEALIVTKNNDIKAKQILSPLKNESCSFERIYFSRGSDADIYQERKALGKYLVADILKMIDGDIDHTVFSFIPNTAEVAYMGMVRELERCLDEERMKQLWELRKDDSLTPEKIRDIMRRKIRTEKLAIKDIKLRTFIAEGPSRNDLASHVYDVTYGCIKHGCDTIVVIDDSIVRGTTLRQSILSMLDRLHPKEIIIVSSSPQVRYPDYYGIDMSRMGEFIAFRAATALLKEDGKGHIIDEVYRECLHQLTLPADEQKNAVKAIYAPFTDEQISAKIADMLTSDTINAKVRILYQTLDGLHKAVPHSPGDWYFSGDYPTPGGTRLVNRAFVNYYEGNPDKR